MTMFTFAVDFDNTLITSKGNGEYEPIEGAAEAMQRLKDRGCRIVIYSCRPGIARKERMLDQEVSFMRDILSFYKIPFDEIFIGEKLVADFYIDDRAIPFRGDWRKTIINVEANIDLLASQEEDDDRSA